MGKRSCLDFCHLGSEVVWIFCHLGSEVVCLFCIGEVKRVGVVVTWEVRLFDVMPSGMGSWLRFLSLAH